MTVKADFISSNDEIIPTGALGKKGLAWRSKLGRNYKRTNLKGLIFKDREAALRAIKIILLGMNDFDVERCFLTLMQLNDWLENNGKQPRSIDESLQE